MKHSRYDSSLVETVRNFPLFLCLAIEIDPRAKLHALFVFVFQTDLNRVKDTSNILL